MKRQKRLTVLLVILVICVAAAILLSRMNFEEKMTGTQTAIIDVDSSEITRLAWNYDGEVAFTYEDDEWKNESDDKMPVNQELLSEIAENLSDIVSDKMVEEPQALSVYGLDDPAYTLTVETADASYDISIGNESFSDGEVYISNGDGYVYLTDSELVDHISYSLLDLVQEEEIPEMETVNSVSIDNENTVDIVYQENAGYCYSDAYTYYLKDGDDYRNLDNENTADLISTLTEFSWNGCVDYYTEDSELSDYGLDDPDAVVTVGYTDEDGEEQEFAYEIGESGGSYYAKLKDSTIVYSIEEDVYNGAVDASYDELKPDEVILLDWDTVDGNDIEVDANTYSVDISGSEEDGYTYTLDGSEIEFGDVLDDLEALTIDSEEEAADPGENKTELSLTFHRNTDTWETVELDFYQYNGTYCISVLNGEETNCVNREDVVDLKESINTIMLDQSE